MKRILKHARNQWDDPDMGRYIEYHCGKWWFWDETWTNLIGPYPTRQLVIDALCKYAEYLNGQLFTGSNSPVWYKSRDVLPAEKLEVLGRGPETWPLRQVIYTGNGRWLTRVDGDGQYTEETPQPEFWTNLVVCVDGSTNSGESDVGQARPTDSEG